MAGVVGCHGQRRCGGAVGVHLLHLQAATPIAFVAHLKSGGGGGGVGSEEVRVKEERACSTSSSWETALGRSSPKGGGGHLCSVMEAVMRWSELRRPYPCGAHRHLPIMAIG